MAKTGTILWDNDGVLVNTEGLYFQACREVLAEVGVDLTLELFQEISLRQGESTLELARQVGRSTEQIAAMHNRRNARYTELLTSQPTVNDEAPGVVEMLARDFRMGIVTSSRRTHFDAIHATSGLLGYMDFVLAREDYGESKPNPEPYLTALERFEIDASRCVVVEDSERGLAAAVAAGLPCFILKTEWTVACEFPQATSVLSSLSEVATQLRQWFG